jgi:hypothetical protein
MGNDVVHRLVLGRDAQTTVGFDRRLQEEAIERILPLRNQRVVAVNDQLIEQLLSVEIDSSAADLSSKDGNGLLPAELEVYLLLSVLEEPDADIGRRGRDEDQSLAVQARQSVIQKLCVLPGDSLQSVEFQWSISADKNPSRCRCHSGREDAATCNASIPMAAAATQDVKNSRTVMANPSIHQDELRDAIYRPQVP